MPTGEDKGATEAGEPARDGAKGELPRHRPTGAKSGRSRDPGSIDVRQVRLAIAAVIAVAVIVVLAVKVLGGDDGGDSGDVQAIAANSVPISYSASDLEAQADNLPHAAYWVGPRDGVSGYELTVIPPQPASSNATCKADANDAPCIYVRYLTGDAAVGDKRADYITVASYSLPGAQDALKSTADGDPSQTLNDEGGYSSLTGGDDDNAYVVFDDEPDIQVEVFSPSSGEADNLVSSGEVERLG